LLWKVQGICAYIQDNHVQLPENTEVILIAYQRYEVVGSGGEWKRQNLLQTSAKLPPV
jgi:hypothetical protein